MQSEELKPCPFCGGNNLRFRLSDIEGWIAHVECTDCDDMLGPMSEWKHDNKEDAEKDAAVVWNRRPCLEAALSAAEPVGVRCTGCGSSWDDERLAEERTKRPALLSCCPERKVIPVYAAPPAPSVGVKAGESPMRFFSSNVDNWGALEWFNRMADACEDHDRKRRIISQCTDDEEKEILEISANTSKMVMTSSAFHLARECKDSVISALTAQVQDVARDLPSEFEKWWDDAGHYVGGVVKMTYTQRKQLAWDAFYASANTAAPSKQEGGHD